MWRDDYAAGNGAPPLFFVPQTGSCAAQTPAQANDGGACVDAADGNSWKAKQPPQGDVRQFGAKCDGATDDTAVFAAALLARHSIILPENATCPVANLVMGDGDALDLNQGMLIAAPGASWLIKLTGLARSLRGGRVDDTAQVLDRATTLSGIAAPGATSITVASATGFVVGNPLTITLDSTIRHVTVITSVAGTTIGIKDAIPASITAVAIATGGAGCSANDMFALGIGGVGPPGVVMATTVSAGAVTATKLEVPGLYVTAPANPASVTVATVNHCTTQPTFNLTTSGAASGATVQTAYPVVWVNSTDQTVLRDLRITGGLVGIQLDGTTVRNSLSRIYLQDRGVGIRIGGTTTGSDLSDFTIWGASGAVGVMVEMDGGAGVAQGNALRGFQVLQHQQMFRFVGASEVDLANSFSDSGFFYCMNIDGGARLRVADFRCGSTNGFEGIGAGGGYGVGIAIWNAPVGLSFVGLTQMQNAVDLHMEAGSFVSLSPNAWIRETLSGLQGTSISGSGVPTPGICGTDPVLTGSKWQGAIQVGTGGVTSCQVTFNSAFKNVPFVTIMGQSMGSIVLSIVSVGPAQFTFTSSADMSGKVVRFSAAGS